nr:hypothetical protein [Tanacetum cinerariifolium]
MPQTEKYITESLGAEVLVRSTNQPQTSYAVAASLSEFELKKILNDKMKTNKSINRSDTQKKLYNALKPDKPLTPDCAWNKSKSIDFRPPQKWISTISKECYKEREPPRRREYPFNLSKPLPLIEDQEHQVVPADYFINNDLEYLKGGNLSSKYVTSTTRTKAAKRVLHDITLNLDMDYLPKRHSSNLEMKRSRIMVKAIDKLLFKKRLMRNLEKFVGGRDYKNDLRLLE